MSVYMLKWINRCILILTCMFLAACSPPSSKELLAKAQAYLAEDELSSAVIELKNILQKDPRNTEAQLLLGEIYISMGDFPLALRELEGALDSGIDKGRVQQQLLKTKNRQGKFREVIGELESEPELNAKLETILGDAYLLGKDVLNARLHFAIALELQPENGPATMGMALVAMADGDIYAATGHYSDAVLWNPNNQELWIQKGNFELANQKPELAIESYSQALKLSGPMYPANLGIARSYVAMGSMKDAESAVNKVLAETKKLPIAFYIKAQILFQQEEYERASNVIERSLKLAPSYPAALYLKAAILFQLERYGLAENLLRALLKLYPDNLQVRLLMATAQFRLGEAEAALGTLESHVDDIETSSGLALLGNLYLRNHKNEDAIRSLNAALILDPENNKIRTQLALVHLANGNTSYAMEELERAVAIGGELVQDDALLVLVKMREGDLDEALLEAQNFQTRHPDSVIAHNILGSVYLAQSKTEAAKLAFEKATKLDNTYSPAVFNLAKMASSTGDTKEARALYRNFLTANPDSIEAYIALGQLELGAGSLEAAHSHFIKAAELDVAVNGEQKVANIPFELGRVALKNKDAESARGYFNRALEISSSTHKQAMLALIQVERAAGNRDLVKTLFFRLEKIMPNSVIYHMMLAEYQLEDKEFASAKTNFKKAADLKHRGATLRYARFLESNNEIEASINVLETWVAVNDSDLSAIAMLGGYYLKEETSVKAIRIYENLDARSPKNAAVLNNLAWAYYLNKDERAEPVARRAYELAPHNPHMADTLGWILVQKGKTDDALNIFDKVLGLNPQNASIYYHAAVAYSRTSRLGDARVSLKKALALGEFPERTEAEVLIDNLDI